MDIKPFICGGLASSFAELGTFPIDTSKIRLQVQGQFIDKSLQTLRYRGMSHAIFKISQEEGITALYNGIKPALLRQGTYGTLTVGLYHGLKDILTEHGEKESLARNVVAGVIAGSVSSSVCNPTDVLKVRWQAHTLPSSNEKSMTYAFADIYRQEGMKGLYRGVGLTATRAGVIAGVQLPSYDLAKRVISDRNMFSADSMVTHFLASTCSAIATSLASNPIDVLKTRMMNQRNITSSSAPLYKSYLDCFSVTLRTEGAMAFYKGLCPTFFRIGPYSVLFFMSYEQLKKMSEMSLFCHEN